MIELNIQGNLLNRTEALEAGRAKIDFSNVTKPYVTETYHSGANWYRLWSDGYIEQGGVQTQPGNDFFTVTLNYPFAGTDYSIEMTAKYSGSVTTYVPTVQTTNKTTTSFKASTYPNVGIYWEARGY